MRSDSRDRVLIRLVAARCRAVLLLEVILALAILFMGMAVIGIQINSAMRMAHDNERSTQALMLAEAKLGQLDSGGINLEREMGADGVMDGDFGKSFPGYFYRFTIKPHEDLDDMFTVKTEILYGRPRADLEPGDIKDAEVVTTLWSFRPSSPTLDLQRDFGLSDEQLDELTASLPPEIDPSDMSPSAFAEMDPATLIELIPQLLEMFGQGFGISEEMIRQAIDSGLLDPSKLPTGAETFLPGDPSGKKPSQEDEDSDQQESPRKQGRPAGMGGSR